MWAPLHSPYLGRLVYLSDDEDFVMNEKKELKFDAEVNINAPAPYENAVDKIKVVRTTNDQNPMKPRNLVANMPEQIKYEQIFAEI